MRARGGRGRVVLGPRRGVGSGRGEVRVESCGVVGLGSCVVVGAFGGASSSASSSSSTPKDSFPFAIAFRFFLGRSVGVPTLSFDN